CRHARSGRILGHCARDDHRIHAAGRESSMSRRLARRRFLTAGLTTAAGASGFGAAIYFADRFGLIPPDHNGFVGIGETLTYATQRLLTSRHSLAREFTRHDISSVAPVNGPHPRDEKYLSLL